MRDVVDRLFSQAAAHPGHPAVVESGVTTNYASFANRVRRLANAIASGHERARVLIHLPQGVNAYAAMFATALAGGVYAPTNISAPIAKQRLVLREFSPDVIISTPELYSALTGEARISSAPLIDPKHAERWSPEFASQSLHELAYIIFTSGSTGIPKGVMIPRTALVHYIAWVLNAIAVTPQDKWSQHPNIAFDLSVLDIYGALCGGATLFPIIRETHRLMPAVAIRELELTIWNSVPSVIGFMIKAAQVTRENLATLRLMTFCGEPLLPEHLEAIFSARPDLSVYNTYGPTEATVSCTLLRLTKQSFANACRNSVALGDPIPGMGISLIGGANADEGEIVITGPQLAKGYLESRDATASAFRRIDVNGKIILGYFTGDFAQRVGRHLYFVGRRDHQTKIRGYRIELGEVNAALRKCGYPMAASAVIGGVLHAFLETANEVDREHLRMVLLEILEPYAIPTYFHAIRQFPRNNNDKIDLPALVDAVSSGKVN
jgi:D-alanine--poly(phosphoribitol) ligase subunit 1